MEHQDDTEAGLTDVHQQRRRSPEVAAAIAAMLDRDPTLAAKEIGSRVGLSISRVARLFKRHIGVSIVAYRNRLRFDRFFTLMGAGAQRRPSLRVAAMTAGFGSYAHFHRLFRSHWGVGPKKALLTDAAPWLPPDHERRPSREARR